MPNDHNKEYMREVARARARQYYYDNKEHVLKNAKKYGSEYIKTAKGKKVKRISQWKRRGIKCDEAWDEVYEWWMNEKTCNICDKEFTDGNKCLDHDHTLEGYNVRGILCRSCNNILREL